jgi:hypothetical protein
VKNDTLYTSREGDGGGREVKVVSAKRSKKLEVSTAGLSVDDMEAPKTPPSHCLAELNTSDNYYTTAVNALELGYQPGSFV